MLMVLSDTTQISQISHKCPCKWKLSVRPQDNLTFTNGNGLVQHWLSCMRELYSLQNFQLLPSSRFKTLAKELLAPFLSVTTMKELSSYPLGMRLHATTTSSEGNSLHCEWKNCAHEIRSSCAKCSSNKCDKNSTNL